jgi:hypothetical protein
VTTSEYIQLPMSWSQDGQLLAFTETNPTTGDDIWVLHMSDRKAQPFLRTQFNEAAPNFSPDGRWLAYVSDESGRREIYVQPYPGPGGKWQISNSGSQVPIRSRTGHALFFETVDRHIIVAAYAVQGDAFVAGKPRLWSGIWLDPSRNN